MEFYHRDFNELVSAGRILWHVEGALKKFGRNRKDISRTTVFGDTNRIHVLIGIDGDFPEPSEVGGMIITSSDRIPLTMGRQTLSGTTKALIFWKSAPLHAVPKSGFFVVTNSNSGTTLISHRF